MTGSAPGSPRQTGQTWRFGPAPSNAVEHEQNIFDAVRSWQWTSMPMTASYRVSGSAVGVTVAGDIAVESRTVAAARAR